MSENSVKNPQFALHFKEHKEMLVLSDQYSTTQRYAIYNDTNQQLELVNVHIFSLMHVLND